MLKDEPVPIYGDGNNVRDWIYVQEHCEVLHNILISDNYAGQIFNIGANCEKSNLEIVKIIANALDKKEYTIKYVQDRLGHDRRYAIDNSKIYSRFSWYRASFERAIEWTVNWYMENQDWLKDIETKKYLNAYKGN